MRLPSLPPDEVGRLVGNLDERDADMRRIWAASPGGLILAAVHIGNNEAIAAGVASRGFPISVIADDTSFPELFELLRRRRAAWGFTLVPWRNLRAMFGVLRRREMLGLLVDWGYRSDGIPVRLFDAWTTLPAGLRRWRPRPGRTSSRSGSTACRTARSACSGMTPIVVASSDPAELQRATQELADAIAGAIRAAPHQWYSFKPLWPAGDAEGADLERRARAMQAGRPDPGPGRDLPRDEADQVGIARPRDRERRAMTFRGRLMFGASWLACRLPERPLFRVAGLAGDVWYRLAPGRAAQARRNLRRVCRRWPRAVAAAHRVRAAATDPVALERLVRSAFRHAVRYYLEVARNPGITREFVDERLADGHARPHRRSGGAGQGGPLRRAPFRLGRARRSCTWRSRSARP